MQILDPGREALESVLVLTAMLCCLQWSDRVDSNFSSPLISFGHCQWHVIHMLIYNINCEVTSTSLFHIQYGAHLQKHSKSHLATSLVDFLLMTALVALMPFHYYSITYNNATLFLFNYCSVIENKHSHSGFFSSNPFWLRIQCWCLLMENRTPRTSILAPLSGPIKTDLSQTLPGATLQLWREIIISLICSQKLLSSSSQAVLKQEFTLRICIYYKQP